MERQMPKATPAAQPICRRRTIAIHEAGHIVAALQSRWNHSEVAATINNLGGRTVFGKDGWRGTPGRSERLRAALLEELVMDFAGATAEVRLAGSPVWEAYCFGIHDVRDAFKISRRLGARPGPKLNRLVKWAARKAEQIVSDHRREIFRIAKVLHETGKWEAKL
jgi:hypothetical protein